MNRVKLRFHAISQIVGSIGVGIIVLTDEAKERQGTEQFVETE